MLEETRRFDTIILYFYPLKIFTLDEFRLEENIKDFH